MNINDKISVAIKDQLEYRGYDLVSVNVVLGSRAAVDLFIDRLDGKPVSIDDCVAVSQIASAVLDVEDIIQGKYNLNVSSPGETRPLRTENDFERFCGGDVTIELENPINESGKKKIRGILQKIENSVVYLSEKHQENDTKIEFSEIKKAVLHRVFKI